ncbi:hypothetical protein [Tenacibaculum maritimum]|nr:hypothetical protein [Tenacibaculum maritimum]
MQEIKQKIKYLKGGATAPIGLGNKIIVHEKEMIIPFFYVNFNE